MEETKSFESRVESPVNQTETEKDISILSNNMNDTENLSELIETEITENESKKTEDIVDSVENEKVTEVNSVEENNKEVNEQSNESNSDIEKKEIENLDEKQEENLEKQEEIAEKQEEIVKGQEEIAEKQEEIVKGQEEIAEKQEEIAEKQEEIVKGQEEIAEKQKEIVEGQEENAEKQEENAETQEEQVHAPKQKDNNNIQEEINEKQDEIFKDEEKEADNEEKELVEDLKEADEKIEQIEEELEEYKSESLAGDNDVIKVEATDGNKSVSGDPSTNDVILKLKYDREELIRSYHYAVAEREVLAARNATAQHKIAEYLRKRRTDDAAIEAERSLEDQEHRYIKTLALLNSMEMQLRLEDELIEKQVMDLKEKKLEKELEGEREMSRVNERRKSVAIRAVFSRSGRRLSVDDVTTMNENDERKSKEVSEIRLENVKLRYHVQKLEKRLREKELLAEGLHLIDFEQLKIENQTYGEKIEERNEELMKLRKKITDTVQILTHLKEKLNFTQKENDVQKRQLSLVEEKVKAKRDVISRTKRARDSLRVDNRKLVRESGLLGFNDLLQDYGDEFNLREDLRHQVEMLKRRHAEVSLNIRSFKKKLNVAKDSVAV